MKAVQKVLFPLFAVFLMYRSFELLKKLMASSPQDLQLSETLLVAFLLTLFLTGIFAIPGFAFPTHRLIGKGYYRLRSRKSLEKLYQIMGVGIFRKILLFAFWGSKKNRQKYFNGTKSGLEKFVFNSKQSEFGHLGAFVLIFLISIPLLYKGYFLLVSAAAFINLIGNIYPIILQRYHRIRIERLTERFTS